MALKLNKTVYGFIRVGYSGTFPNVISDIICQFYRNLIESDILQHDEDISLYNLLFDTLKTQKGNEKMKQMDTNLLFRASEHKYSSDKFHEFCDEKGPTITIIENEYGHVFGGYVKESWKGYEQQINDPNAFLFMIRPKIEAFHLKTSQKSGVNALWIYPKYGPVFGKGADVWIKDKCHTSEQSGCLSNHRSSFKFDAKEMSGCTKAPDLDGRLRFKINNYEIFSLVISE